MSTIRKSKFVKQRNFEPLKGQNFIAAKLNAFTVFIQNSERANSWNYTAFCVKTKFPVIIFDCL